jgi:protein PhnA
MQQLPPCPKCGGVYTYEDGMFLICPECGHEWAPEDEVAPEEAEMTIKDANGNILKNGDTVVVIKDLKVKGSASGIKAGTKIKNIKLVESKDAHNIDCKVPGIGAIKLKQMFVKKA